MVGDGGGERVQEAGRELMEWNDGMRGGVHGWGGVGGMESGWRWRRRGVQRAKALG